MSKLLSPRPKAFIFDVFGTVVDWRTTVEAELRDAATRALAAKDSHISAPVRERATSLKKSDFARFAQEWRTAYMKFCRAVANDEGVEWKSVDAHHLDSLKELIVTWNLESLWTTEEIVNLSLVWHRLDPWADSVKALRALHSNVKTATLSNGNTALLQDLVRHGNLEFDLVLGCCEELKTYKPNSHVYNRAIEILQLKPEECAMVAAHLFDLKAARKSGMRTIYIARPNEEESDQTTIDEIRNSGDIDLWVEQHENGLLGMCKSLEFIV